MTIKLIFTQVMSVVTTHGYIVRCTGTDEICLNVKLQASQNVLSIDLGVGVRGYDIIVG